VPFAVPSLRLLYALRGLFYVNSYVKPEFLTHDAERIASYRTDPLIARPIAVNVLLDLYWATKRVVADAQAITQPVQLFISGQDWVVQRAPQAQFFAQLANPTKACTILPGFLHDTLGERDRAPVLEQIRSFVLERLDQPAPSYDHLLKADVYGPSAQEAKALAFPLPKTSWRFWWWALLKLNLRLGQRWSRGIALGQATGYDSGATLDYVYANRAQGLGPIGRFIDRVYLESIGWRGIRQRKLLVEELFQKAARHLAQNNQACRILDLACGHARYLVDAVKAMPTAPESLLLRDYCQENLLAAQAYAQAAGLGSVCRTEQADAFLASDLQTLPAGQTLAVVSGLYELFADNTRVLRSLRGVSQSLASGGFLVLTNQPWHPQLELIARGLTSHRQGQAWIMRRRSQAELDALACAAGLKKLEQRIDAFGIFTVCLFQKR
jgi:SAM-dependent methyltransferase